MARYQRPSRSDEEWFRIINECRHSDLGMFEGYKMSGGHLLCADRSGAETENLVTTHNKS